MPHPLLLSLRSTTRQPRKIANIRITASPPATAEKPAHSPALTDSRSRLLTHLRAHALRLRSTVTVSARTQVHALQVQVRVPGRAAPHLPVRRGDGLAAALAQRRGRNGQPAVCTAEDLVHGNASTLAVISKAVSAFLTGLSHSRVFFFFVKLTASFFFVRRYSRADKKVVAARSHLHLSLPSARIVQRSSELQTSRVCMANVLSTAVSRDTSLRSTTIAASASTLDSMMQSLRTYQRGFMDWNTFPSGGNEKNPKIISASP